MLTDVFKTETGSDSNSTAPISTTADQSQYEFIGEGKQYADANAALSSIPHKDSHIAKIEQENSEMRAKLVESTSLNEVLNAMKENGDKTQTVQQQVMDTPTETPDVANIVRDVLQEEQARTSAEKNIAEANKFVLDAFGDKAPEVVKMKANDLGMELEDLQRLAARSSAAFTALFPQQQSVENTPQQTQGDVNTQAMLNIPQSGQARYEAIRKSDSKSFMSPSVQLAQMKEAMSDPEKYFNS